MKIEKVGGKYQGIFGDAEIHMDSNGIFYIKLKDSLPEEFKYDALPKADTLLGIRKMIDEFCETQIRQSLVKQKLFICVGTSSEKPGYNMHNKSMFDQDHWKMFMDGDGFYVSYAIMNVYSFKYKTIVGMGDTYIKNRTATNDPIYGWKEKELYEIVDGNSERFKTSAGILMERRDALFKLKYTHEMDYDPNVHQFLIGVSKSIGDMVERVMDFFNVPPENLIQNVLSHNNEIKLLN